MAETMVLHRSELPAGSKKAVKVGETQILLIHLPGERFLGVEAKCPHAGGPLEQGAICDGKLVCPWHMGTFALPSGAWLEPPPLRSLKTYAVRIEGESILVDPTPITEPTMARDCHTPARAQDDRHFVVVGAGAASASAVCTLRRKGFAGRITLIDPVASEPIDRTNLSKMALSGKKDPSTLPLWSSREADALSLERVKAAVTALDPDAQTVTLSSGQRIRFDAALIATGGTPVKLDVPGAELPHVYTLRHLADLEAILAAAKPGTRVAIVGGSFIALEAASALTTRGLHVTVIAREEMPFAKKLGAAPARALLSLHRSKGVTIREEAEVSRIAPGTVTLKNGTELPAEMVLLALGIRPVTYFAQALPLTDKQLVQTGADMKAAGAVWAAGDITSVAGTHIEHWRVAQQQGRAAALGMLGEPATPGTPFFWTTHFGKRLGYAGHAEEWDELFTDGDVQGLSFVGYYMKNGRVIAGLACGRDTAMARLEASLHKRLTLGEARHAAGTTPEE